VLNVERELIHFYLISTFCRPRISILPKTTRSSFAGNRSSKKWNLFSTTVRVPFHRLFALFHLISNRISSTNSWDGRKSGLTAQTRLFTFPTWRSFSSGHPSSSPPATCRVDYMRCQRAIVSKSNVLVKQKNQSLLMKKILDLKTYSISRLL